MVVSNFIQILSNDQANDFLVGVQGTWGKFLGQNIVGFWKCMWLNTVPECNCTVNECQCIYDSPSSTGPGGQIDVSS